jgi:hypothetical protein
MSTQRTMLVMCLASAALAGCTPPKIEKTGYDESATSEDDGSDEFSSAQEEDESGGGEGGGELSPNACLLDPEEGKHGYRHHCGGFMTFNFSGHANGHEVAESYSYGFGPTYADAVFEDIDTYANPVVMACCGGPYDFDEAPSAQPTYFKNCKADAVQQMCSAMGQWLIKLAEDYPLAKGALYDAAEILGSQANQTACNAALYEDGENFNEVSDTSWDIAVGNSSLTIEVDLIEILDIAYDEPPAVCESIFENDDNLLPLLTQTDEGDLDVLALENGHITLTDGRAYEQAVTPADGYMSVGMLDDGDVELRSLVLRNPSPVVLVVDSVAYTVDSWNLALIGPVSATPRSPVTNFPAGTASFSMSVLHDGSLYRAGGTNTSTFTLTPTSRGDWHLDGLEVAFEDDPTTWSFYNSSPLVFGP